MPDVMKLRDLVEVWHEVKASHGFVVTDKVVYKVLETYERSTGVDAPVLHPTTEGRRIALLSPEVRAWLEEMEELYQDMYGDYDDE